MCLVGPLSPRGKSEICVKFNPGFIPFINFHDIFHTYFSQLIPLTGFTEYLGDNHNFDGCFHHHDDDVEGILCYKYRNQLGTVNDEVKHENVQPEPVSTNNGWSSLIFLTINFGQHGG